MAHYWARLRARTNAPLRRGAWYRVVRLNGRQAVLDVNRQLLPLSRAMLQVLPIRPPAWSVVPTPPNSAFITADRYGVCPNCADRARLDKGAEVMRCRRCRSVFAIAWSDAAWRALEVKSGAPDEAVLARARAAALEALTRAFRLERR
jgi:hypothetical protein